MTRLSTPISRHLRGVQSWREAGASPKHAFRKTMHSRAYGREETRSAWAWFITGYYHGVTSV